MPLLSRSVNLSICQIFIFLDIKKSIKDKEKGYERFWKRVKKG